MAPSKIPIVKTAHGPVKGVIKSTSLGRTIYDFRAIPYMKAPTGKLRFRDAQPPEAWTVPLDTNIERPSYISSDLFTRQVAGQQDAGIVSVSTPYLDRKLPVAVYIHGGGFQLAYGKVDMYGGDYLLQKDIVYVTMNYRVGPMGFLSLNDPQLEVPGNAGLKDQVLALKWIQKNISNFGGDPDNVTIFGTSAGGASVHFLMMSELGKGLFRKAIPMSGTSFMKSWLFTDKHELAERLAKAVGWNEQGGERGLLEALESATAEDIVAAEAGLLTQEEKLVENISFPFTPVIEPYVNKRTFLAKDPVLVGRQNWSNNIDCLIGGCSLEGAISLMWLNECKDSWPEFYQDPAAFTLTRELRLDLSKPSDKQKATEYGLKLKKLYFGEGVVTPDTRNQYLLFSSDLIFWHGIYRTVLSRLHANGKGKTYLYRFNLNTSLNMMKTFLRAEYEGASHGDDVSYIFKPNIPGMPGPAIDSKEFGLIQQMVSYITSFVINGNPNNLDPEGKWEPVTSDDPLKCFNISNDSTETIALPEFDRLKVWNEIWEDANVPLY